MEDLAAPLHVLACDRKDPGEPALVHVWADGAVDRLTFGELRVASVALARRMEEAGVERGQRVAISLFQSPLAATAHLALSRLGALAVPLSPLLGPEALAPRLARAGCVLGLVDAARADAFQEAAPPLVLWRAEGRVLRMARAPLPSGGSGQAPFDVPSPIHGGDAPLALFFTSGTSAQPKGVVLPHRVVPGRLPGFRLAHPDLAQRSREARRFWSPAEWSWIGGLHDALFAPWLAGCTVVSWERRGAFEPARAAALLEGHGVTNAFLPPTALKAWRRSGAPTPRLHGLHTAGEPLAAPTREWAEASFGAPTREVYGLTEAAFLVVNRDARPDATGVPVPGVELDLAQVEGEPEAGEVRVRPGAPTLMLGYLEEGRVHLPLDDEGWFRTGDLARRVGPGALRIVGRLDDVIKTSGHRVSPGEIEAVLLGHPDVAEAAVVGEADEARGQRIAAFVKATPGVEAGPALAEALAQLVRERLGAHMVPRRVVFVDELPTTPSGKIVRRALRS